MLVKYVTTSGATTDQMIADLVAIITGGTIASLSASCDKVNSAVIANSTATGWTLFDSFNVTVVGTTGGYVLTANAATGSTVKYARLYKSASNAVDIVANETWNAGTHTGTNLTTGAGGISLSVSTTYMVFATARTFMIWNSTGTAAAVCEFTRDCPYLSGTTYPSYLVASQTGLAQSGGQMYMPRQKNLTATGDSTNVTVNAGTISNRSSGQAVTSTSSAVRDATDSLYHEMRPIWVVTNSNNIVLGRLYDYVEITRAAGNAFDTFSDGTDSYMIAAIGGHATIAVKIT